MANRAFLISLLLSLAVAILSEVSATPAATTLTGYFKVLTHTCTDFAGVSWGGLKYTCAWQHKRDGQTYYNLFLVRYNGGIEKECFCQDGLSSYSSWGSIATFSTDVEVACYTKDGTKALAMRTKFGSIACPGSPLAWVDLTAGARPSGSGASRSPGISEEEME